MPPEQANSGGNKNPLAGKSPPDPPPVPLGIPLPSPLERGKPEDAALLKDGKPEDAALLKDGRPEDAAHLKDERPDVAALFVEWGMRGGLDVRCSKWDFSDNL